MAFTLIIPKPLLINYAGFSPKFETVPEISFIGKMNSACQVSMRFARLKIFAFYVLGKFISLINSLI